MGNVGAGGSIVNGGNIIGVGLSSNKSLLGINSGYRYTYNGIAEDFSNVIVRQNGVVIYTESVSPGPFTLADMRIVRSGELTVEVVATNGNTTVNTIPLNLTPQMLEDGMSTFEFNIGSSTISNNVNSDSLLGSFSYNTGFDGYSLSAEAVFNKRYLALGGRIDKSLSNFGALSITTGISRLFDDRYNDELGTKLTLSYSNSLNSNIKINGFVDLYGSQPYQDFSSYDYTDGSLSDSGLSMQYNLSTSFFDHDSGRLSLSIWGRDYIEREATTGYSATFSKTIKDITFNLGTSFSNNNGEYEGSISTLFYTF